MRRPPHDHRIVFIEECTDRVRLRLTQEQRKAAANISKVLFEAREQIGNESMEQIQAKSIKKLNSDPLLKTEYFQFADRNTLQPLKDHQQKQNAVICTAVRLGNIRLIDNVFV